MAFTSASIVAVGDGWLVAGEVSVRGVAKPLELEVAMTGSRVFPLDGKEHIGFVARGRLSRSAFGVGVGVPDDVLSDAILVDLAVQLVAT